MTKKHPRQLELPVMVDVNSKTTTGSMVSRSTTANSYETITSSSYHKPASAGDQSIYKAISDNYFGTTVKQA